MSDKQHRKDVISGVAIGLGISFVAVIVTLVTLRNKKIAGISPVNKLNIQEYTRLPWYEISSIRHSFQSKCDSDTIANYQLNQDNSVTVTNECLDKDGQQILAVGLAKPDTRYTSLEDGPNDLITQSGKHLLPARLRLRFKNKKQTSFLPFTANYWVVDIADDYSWAVVSSPTIIADFLWILSRQKTMSDDVYNAIINRLENRGFPVDKLTKTTQN
jgi:apolipoprotein D and lipocalin family protein